MTTPPGDEAARRRALCAVVDRVALRARARELVLIDGRSGAGKSSFADDLRDLLDATGRTVALVRMDDVYPGWTGLAAAASEVSTRLVRPFLSTGVGCHGTWDWQQSTPGSPRTTPPGADLLLLEGCGSSSHVRDLDPVVVWLQAPERTRLQRAIDRDGPEYARWARVWSAQEDAVLRGPLPGDLVLQT